MNTTIKTLATAALAAFTFGFTPSAQADTVAQVTIGGVTTPYATIEAAWEAACASTETPTVLTLLKDIALTDTLITTGSANFTFDLNGKTLSAGGDFSGRLIYQFSGSEQTIKNGTITGAKSTAVHCENAQKMTIDHVVLTGNSSENGGAVFCNHNTRLLMKDCVVTNNVATGSGGGIYKVGFQASTTSREDKMVLVRTVIRHNRATNGNGGGVYFMSTQCLAAGTMIRMADGTEKAIENVAEGDYVATFDHEGGTNASARVFLATKGKTKELPFTLTFDNGVTLSIVGRHDLLEQTSLKYVTIDEANAAGYVGKSFYGADGQWHTLTGVQQATEKSDYYSIYTAQHLNSFANGMLTVADDVDYLLNIYELDGSLKADAAQLAADIAQYGLADFDETAAQYGISRAWFDDAGTKYYPVAIGKGLATLEGLEALFASTQANDDPTIEGATEGVLTLGEGVIVTDNTAQGKPSNIYLVPYVDDWPAYIALAESHSGICAGVTTAQTPTEGSDVQFMGYGATAGDVGLFTSDEGYSVIYRESALFLSVNPPVTPVEYREPVYKTAGDPKSGIQEWVTKSVSEYTVVTSATGAVTWGTAGQESWYVVMGADVQIDGGVTCAGDVNLILCEGANLTVADVAYSKAGIATDASGSFTVYGQPDGAGVLAATSGEMGAGIGGGNDAAGSNITINGGTVKATGDNYGGAGIGGGSDGAGENITINGGTVTATGGNYGAGIGGGKDAAGSNITINGGTVVATTYDHAAGIGGGGNAPGGFGITINGGNVTAVGGYSSAGIGGGPDGAGVDIAVNGGTVTAEGGLSAAGIGGGFGSPWSSVGVLSGVGSNITIRAGKVFVRAPVESYSEMGVAQFGELIGGGASAMSKTTGVVIESGANVCFNLTGECDEGEWVVPSAPMPDDFSGLVVMTPENLTHTRVLAGGAESWSAGSTFALTNAATGATLSADVGQKVEFASRFCRLEPGDGSMSLVLLAPEAFVDQLPDVTNGYVIVAHTDANNGIVNYAWMFSEVETLNVHALTNLVSEDSSFLCEGESIKSVMSAGTGNAVAMMWNDGALPEGGEFHFTCQAKLIDFFREMGLDVGTLTQDGENCVFVPKKVDIFEGAYVLTVGDENGGEFQIDNLTYVVDAETTIDEGATMTQFPADKGVSGQAYFCRMTFDHNGVLYTDDSEEFTYAPPSVEYRYPVYKTAGDPKSGIDHWVTNNVSAYEVVTDQTTWGEAGETKWYVLTNDVTIADRITCLGQVNLILTDGATLTASLGITASPDTEGYLGFTVYAQSEGEAMGALVAADNVPKRYAGIGGWHGSDQNKGFSGSNITINGGTVRTAGGQDGAGIGGGNDAAGSYITINGGIVTATGTRGAGIGGGERGPGSNITINGGAVVATGTRGGAGIGGGADSEGTGSYITINGGTVLAQAPLEDLDDDAGSGIGGGEGASASDITISGGTVTALGSRGNAAIGGGKDGSCSNVTIAEGATVFVHTPAILLEEQYISADVIGKGADFGAEEPPTASGVVIASGAKVFYNLTGVADYDAWEIEPMAPMPASFEGFTIMTPETAVTRVLVGGCAAWTAAETFNLKNAISGATGSITVNDGKGVQFANKLLKLPHADSTLTLTAEDPPTGIQVGDDAWANVVDGVCTITGSGPMWNLTTKSTNPLAEHMATMKDIVVEDGVTDIGAQFFHKFRAVTNVTVAASVTNVADYAFFRCESIDAIAFGAAQADVKLGTDSIAYYLAIKMDESTGKPVPYTVPEVTFNGQAAAMLGTESLENPKWELVEPGQEGKYHFFKLAPMQ